MGFDQDLFKRALDLAARAHGDQKVPGNGFPYIVHVTKVAMEVLAVTEGEPDLNRDLALACALLHDTVEDAGDRMAAAETLAQIRATFGEAVADGVLALTKNAELSNSRRATAWRTAASNQGAAAGGVARETRGPHHEPGAAAARLDAREAPRVPRGGAGDP